MELGWNEPKGACWNAFGVTKTLVPMPRVGSVVFFTHLSLLLYHFCIFFCNPHKEMLEDTVPLLSVGETLEATVGWRATPSIFLFLPLFLSQLSAQQIPPNENNNSKKILFLQHNNCQCVSWALMTLQMLTSSTTNSRYSGPWSPRHSEMCRGADHAQALLLLGTQLGALPAPPSQHLPV